LLGTLFGHLYCVPALTLDASRILNSQIASGRCSVLCSEDVETVSPEYIPTPLSSCISFIYIMAIEVKYKKVVKIRVPSTVVI
jgi:hypothetical protein